MRCVRWMTYINSYLKVWPIYTDTVFKIQICVKEFILYTGACIKMKNYDLLVFS